MNWNELIRPAGEDMVLLSLATTGIDPDDEVLGAAVTRLSDSGVESRTIIRKVPDDKLQKSYEYHQIDVNRMHVDGMEPDEFARALSDLLDGARLFTYNVRWALPFLDAVLGHEPKLYDFCKLVKLIESRMHLVEDDAELDRVMEVADSLGKPMSMSRMLGYYDIQPGFSLPLENNVRGMHEIWDRLGQFPVP